MLASRSEREAGRELVERAEQTARGLLEELGERWAHVQGVVRAAEHVLAVLDERDQPYLIAAALLHDIGYAPALVDTGFHALDGARYLVKRGEEWRICCLVAYHSSAEHEAHARGVESELTAFDHEEGAVMDALVYADMTTGPTGFPTTLAERITDIRRRYPADDPVLEALREAEPYLKGCVARTEARLQEV